MNILIFIISFSFISIPTLIFPPIHKILRKKNVYVGLCIVSMVLPIISLFVFKDSLTEIEKKNSFISLCPLIFLILYKYYDSIILRKYNRHIYFFVSWYINYFWEDNETDESTTLEFWLKISLFVIPLFITFGLSELFIKYI